MAFEGDATAPSLDEAHLPKEDSQEVEDLEPIESDIKACIIIRLS